MEWTKVLRDFYGSFRAELERAEEGLRGEVPTDILCPECGRPMGIKSGKNGVFLACTGFPGCRHATDFTRDEKGKIVVQSAPDIRTDAAPCEKCGRPMAMKNGKFGSFLACTGYPECRNTRPLSRGGGTRQDRVPSDVTCRKCGGAMQVRVNRAGQRFLACDNYPGCTHTEPVSTRVPCPVQDCGGTLVEKSSKRGRTFYSCDRYPKCRFAMWDEPFDAVCPECGSPVLGMKRPKGADSFLSCRRKGCGFTRPAALESAPSPEKEGAV